jgi:dTDP-4-dehydrorhamnose 3,5-epimerase
MKITSLAIPDVKLIEAQVFKDDRGFFLESYSKRAFEQAGIKYNFIQDNHSRSTDASVIRGLHFQLPPHAQAKLIRVTKGKIWDVAVDLRKVSPTYSHYVSTELSAQSFKMLFIPAGFAHGFVTLDPDCEIQYKTDAYYAPNHEGGIRWDDPDLAIDWPIKYSSVTMSEKDALLPTLENFQSPF